MSRGSCSPILWCSSASSLPGCCSASSSSEMHLRRTITSRKCSIADMRNCPGWGISILTSMKKNEHLFLATQKNQWHSALWCSCFCGCSESRESCEVKYYWFSAVIKTRKIIHQLFFVFFESANFRNLPPPTFCVNNSRIREECDQCSKIQLFPDTSNQSEPKIMQYVFFRIRFVFP